MLSAIGDALQWTWHPWRACEYADPASAGDAPAFTEISRRAYAALADELPSEYQQQQTELNGLMSLMSGSGKLLRFYALKHACLSQTEQVEQAR